MLASLISNLKKLQLHVPTPRPNKTKYNSFYLKHIHNFDF